MPDHTHDPARVSEETLRSFETDLPEPESHDEASATRPLRRQGALILGGMVAVIAVGVIAVLGWLL